MKKQFSLLFFLLTSMFISEFSLSQKPLFTSPIGIQTYTFRRSINTDAAKVLDTIKMWGIKEVEGFSQSMKPEEFKKLCDARGIKIPSTGADYAKLVKSPDSIAMQAKALGAKFVMCAWIPHNDGVFTLDDAKKAVEDFNKAGKILKQNELTFCYHVHGFEFQPYEGGTLLDYLIKNTNPAYVSFQMDIFWVQFGGGDPAALLNKYGSRWKLMHVKDMHKGIKKDLTGGTSVENDVALGTGELNLPAILKAAKKAGIKHYFIEDESSSYASQVPQSIAYLKSLKE